MAPAARIRPRDAATLIVLDLDAEPRILMGRRAMSHVFMPGRYVFPGGRVEPDDLRRARSLPLAEAALERLAARTTARHRPHHGAALAIAALRETFEETGLVLCAPAEAPASAPAPHAAGAIAFEPRHLVPVARAITPTGLSRRFDTRFFAVSARHVSPALSLPAPPTDEFDALGWFTFEEIAGLDCARITRLVISEIETRVRDGSWQDPSLSIPFWRTRQGRHVCERI
ncbi:NUDIX domain-containing protein [Aurantimonas sp. Leaf443]|uniref:NUDIX hydrolase n=1 Tax=Aurantimonas sp. Leaf443 TaxID=1736378 RepID=UPI0006FFA2B6|nr:NUDIX domain-containing protein [Aurantimonas sp. Leaf443]KQT86309.1 hypothetical protein ASG48_07075 [Aurantimonas sp. Leaf443]